jgi:hypothetical protein
MNDFGFALAWLALQVALVLAPALMLQSIAARKNPASGAWVATFSLALAIVLAMTLAMPRLSWNARSEQASDSPVSREKPTDQAVSSSMEPTRSSSESTISSASNPSGWSFAKFRSAWSRLETRASAPVERFRPWGRVLACVAVVASALGLIRLVLGLWAVEVCRRRGRLVEDVAILALVEELRIAMGCRRAVELREVADLATPATAGWFRPLLLTPSAARWSLTSWRTSFAATMRRRWSLGSRW